MTKVSHCQPEVWNPGAVAGQPAYTVKGASQTVSGGPRRGHGTIVPPLDIQGATFHAGIMGLENL